MSQTLVEAPPALRLRDVTKRYGRAADATAVLSGVSAAFPAGTFTALMGPSGSGKTTMLMCAAGLTRPTTGTVEVAGQRIDNLSDKQLTRLRRDRVGFVFQHFNLIDSLTAVENVYLPARLAGRPALRGRAVELLNLVGLGERLKHRPAQLSGGQRQRVAIARALLTEPVVLFADEPTGALDQEAGREVLDLLRRLATEQGTTIVMVTHDAAAAAAADRVLLLFDGVLSAELHGASAEEIAHRVVSHR
ncbi:ABC transporter ATP-binding protein [Winogradskya consettensis]|uniref:ABC transporter ATP-binding protein n=2 Tax=Winogradskya TaxID=3240235 RepID=A0A919SHA8_9ACTN|nr:MULTISPECIES: ABC transporter ATP-binding protein [Actinoplanes]GIE26894.1 ABC transporter ATP-binding protein [Actinoplanes humidus]GIM71567.1 ABC transporter ATP-binding protein [Actinoplanes consettensis]